MPQFLKVGVAQSRTLSTTSATLSALAHTSTYAASRGVHIVLWPECYLGGYPRTSHFGSTIGARSEKGYDQFLAYFNEAVDLGDTPRGGGDAWVERQLPVPRDKEFRGDGTREELERIAKETGVFLVVGLVERSGGSLYCAAVYVDPKRGCIGKRRKVMPTGAERVVWAQGSPSTLKAVTAVINGVKVTLAAAICWENYMPLLRHSLYSQNVNLYCAPTADARDTWLALMRTIALEGRTFVMSANQCVRKDQLPSWMSGESKEEKEGQHQEMSKINWPDQELRESVAEDADDVTLPKIQTATPNGTSTAKSPDPSKSRRRSIIPIDHNHELHLPLAGNVTSSGTTATATETAGHEAVKNSSQSEFACRGGSCIVDPTGKVLSGPLWEKQENPNDPGSALLIQEIDMDDCIRGRLDFDAAGSYSRSDAFKLTVEELNLDPIE